MKNIIFIILTLISTCCLAISQKLIDGADKYNAAVENLKEIEIDLSIAKDSPKYWSKILNNAKNASYASDDIKKFYQNKIDESNKQIIDLNIQYNIAKETVKKYEPLKKKYDKQKEKEEKRGERRAEFLSLAGSVLFPLCAFILILRFLALGKKRCERLLDEGKITQEEYEHMMKCSDSSVSNDSGINPSTGLPMTGVGISDVGGNARGSSPYRSNYDYLQEHRDRHRWDK